MAGARAQRSSAGRVLPTREPGAALAATRGNVGAQEGAMRVHGAAEQLGLRPIYLGVPHQFIGCSAGTFGGADVLGHPWQTFSYKLIYLFIFKGQRLLCVRP